MIKQNITIEQLLEGNAISKSYSKQNCHYLKLNELFTIGRMIKLLDDSCVGLLICKSKYDTGDMWEVTLIDEAVFIQEELCDALWNALIYVYDKEEDDEV